ncbi:hypothetical protein [Emticicia sp. C21]|uniref:hypothetical protein n=1 Tax=Emticicia sp. C21 TaxID=2302915 RepID=UPI000E349C73|nr:hypothetical protein [Emticicia sp. C21]RFS17716.1 hypothetical protein D0T08_00220 [Emticicia sp. C21]
MVQKHLIVICLALAVVLLFIATLLYPGGSQASLQSSGYDWANNYLCNLFDAKGMNGISNPGMLWAFAGMFFLCLGLGIFFYRTSAKIQHLSSAMIIRYAGMTAMFFAFFVVTRYHDIMVTISCTFAMLAIFYLSVFVFTSRSLFFKILTTLCLITLYFSDFVYYSSTWLEILPITQKATYLLIIIWVLGLEYYTTAEDFPYKAKQPES